MSAAWVAGSTRARLLAGRRLGRDALLQLASSTSVDEVALRLQATAYGREATLGTDVPEIERAVAEVTLLRLRMLAGWLPSAGLGLMRTLAAWFELANIEDRIAYLVGERLPRAFVLASLAVAWPRVAPAQSLAELRAALAGSIWGDPGSEDPARIQRALRLALGERILAAAPEAERWVAGSLGVLAARDLVGGRASEQVPRAVGNLLGLGWQRSRTLGELAGALPLHARRPLEGLERPEDLWRAEARCWLLVEREAEAMAAGPGAGPRIVVGAVALLAADAHWTISAVSAAARGAREELEEALASGA